MAEKPLTGVELKRFLRTFRREYQPMREVSLLLQSVEYPYNVGAIFRLAEGANASWLILSGLTPRPPNPTIEKVGRYKSRKIRWSYIPDPLKAVDIIADDGYSIIALELTDSALPYFKYDYPEKVCLVVGHEDHGVTKATLARCDGVVFVPMYGQGRSHNVQTALSIVLYHVLHSPRPR